MYSEVVGMLKTRSTVVTLSHASTNPPVKLSLHSLPNTCSGKQLYQVTTTHSSIFSTHFIQKLQQQSWLNRVFLCKGTVSGDTLNTGVQGSEDSCFNHTRRQTHNSSEAKKHRCHYTFRFHKGVLPEA